ncbi:hypothetical protein [uncultured Pseudoteredinibacter sp.]|uniref:hypothetical protein n=1 Tax=uncultured Pseudoteredinibacter sp. TaxID=1641701 RepID=UPI0026102B16|nr:hypothetical protein [uncultured Pseudoteredinibacter sp.]
MKIFIFFFLSTVSCVVSAWECGDYDKYSQSVGQHLEIASDVFFGRVLSGSVESEGENGFDVSIEVDVLLEVKGDLEDRITLFTHSQPPFPEFILGGSYVFFLYGNTSLDFCNYLIETAVPIDSLDELREYSKRRDIRSVEQVREVLMYIEGNLNK